VPHVVRFKAPRTGSTIVNDLVFGPVETPHSQLQDFVIMRRNGLPLYNLACVVDDHQMGITVVGRGRDHLGNTPQQQLLYLALGYDLPKFAHLPMMLSVKGDKLSKRNADVNVSDYRERGYTPMGVLNYLVRFGWSHGDQEIFSRQELTEHFSWDRVNKSDGKFDPKKFADVAFEQLKRTDLTSDADYLKGVLPFLHAKGIVDPDPATLKGALPLIRERARSLEDAAHHLDFYFRDPPSMEEKGKKKFLTAAAAPILKALSDHLSEVAQSQWLAAPLEEAFKEWVEKSQLQMKEAAQPARVALTGRSASPGLFEVMQLLGKKRCIERLVHASEIAARG
jgi:glutamyl-tRNA synthetase